MNLLISSIVYIGLRVADSGNSTGGSSHLPIQSGYLTFSDEWGTNRGFVWSRTCQLFSELPFYQQITGIGPGGFSTFFSSYNAERAAMGLSDFVDSHNEGLYYLVATGFVGMIGYFGMIVTALVECVKYE